MCIKVHSVIAHLQVELCWERSIFHIADIVLGEVQIGEVAKATQWRKMDRPNLVLIQPQIHNSAVEWSVNAVDVWQRGKIILTNIFIVKFPYLLMWEGMVSYGGWFILQIASHTKPFSPSISQQSAVTIGNRIIDSRASQQRKELAVDRTTDEEPPVTLCLCRPCPVLRAIWDVVTISIGESRAKMLAI